MRPLFDTNEHQAGPFSNDKILWHHQEIQKLADGGVPSPITAEIDLTNACDLACPYCSQREIKALHETLSPTYVIEAIEDLVDLGTKGIVFTGGGEPLIHKQVGALIAYARSRGLQPALITNGTRLSSLAEVDINDIVDYCEWIRVSVDAYDRESYLASKGVDSYRKVIAGLDLLVRLKKERKSHVTIGIGYVTHAGNFPGFAILAKRARNLGVDYIQARPLIFLPGDERVKDYPLGADADALTLARLEEQPGFKVYASVPKYEDVSNARPYSRCYGLYFATSIGANGDVWACCHARGIERLSLGNIKERPLKDIWRDVDMRRAVYSRVNLAECMPLCRMHGTNRLLDRVNWHPTHVNFL